MTETYKNILGKLILKKTCWWIIGGIVTAIIFCIWCYLSCNFYVQLERNEIVGTWKLTSETANFRFMLPYSHLVLYEDGTYEYHNPSKGGRECLPGIRITPYSSKCGDVFVGQWFYSKSKVSSGLGFEKVPCTFIRLGKLDDDRRKYYNCFHTQASQMRQRLVSYQPAPDGNVVVLTKISLTSKCPHCRKQFSMLP